MALTSKKRARPTTKSPNDGLDPVGFGATLAEIIAELQDAYRARLHAFLRMFLLLGLAPAVRRSIFAAVTARGRPVIRLQDHILSPRCVRLLSCSRRTEDAGRRTLG